MEDKYQKFLEYYSAITEPEITPELLYDMITVMEQHPEIVTPGITENPHRMNICNYCTDIRDGKYTVENKTYLALYIIYQLYGLNFLLSIGEDTTLFGVLESSMLIDDVGDLELMLDDGAIVTISPDTVASEAAIRLYAKKLYHENEKDITDFVYKVVVLIDACTGPGDSSKYPTEEKPIEYNIAYLLSTVARMSEEEMQQYEEFICYVAWRLHEDLGVTPLRSEDETVPHMMKRSILPTVSGSCIVVPVEYVVPDISLLEPTTTVDVDDLERCLDIDYNGVYTEIEDYCKEHSCSILEQIGHLHSCATADDKQLPFHIEIANVWRREHPPDTSVTEKC